MFLPPNFWDCQIKFQLKLKSFMNELKNKILINSILFSLNNRLNLTGIFYFNAILQQFHQIGRVERANLHEQFFQISASQMIPAMTLFTINTFQQGFIFTEFTFLIQDLFTRSIELNWIYPKQPLYDKIFKKHL